mmetsp:Transcript_44206/g.60378  ORF Transcript_44206/g.60378 Transcript_44206/m.60378 type:complete len:90 (+) Transcript_44206:192-461(+)
MTIVDDRGGWTTGVAVTLGVGTSVQNDTIDLSASTSIRIVPPNMLPSVSATITFQTVREEGSAMQSVSTLEFGRGEVGRSSQTAPQIDN